MQLHWIDWFILFGTLIAITLYGMWRTRGQADMKTYLMGNRTLKWWTIGLSIMATQASAITFLSTTGQGYEKGMGFAQFYFGLPIAMVVLSVFFLPIFYKLNVFTAYEYLEKRFDVRSRYFVAFLFLLSRGMAAGLTIYAPAIVLSTILGWQMWITILALGIFVISYTVVGGSEAVSVTQQQQMTVILSGLVVAFLVMIYKLPDGVGLHDALRIAGKMDKTQIVDFSWNLKNRYTFWTGMLGGTFLFLSYFGTDQSQVQRYLGGKSMSESRLGLMFNGLLKVPMQFLVLFVGIMMYVFYQFTPSPIHFNRENLAKLNTPQYQSDLKSFENQQTLIFNAKRAEVEKFVKQTDPILENENIARIKSLQNQENLLRDQVKTLIKTADPKADTKDRDYVFITFVIQHLPRGIVGLLLAVIFSAAMSSKSSELNALATTSVVDFYKRAFVKNASDMHYMKASKWFTAGWGVVALAFAMFANLSENLIEAVNIIGSLFYGVILGVFVVAFFLKRIGGSAVFWSAVLSEILIVTFFLKVGLGDPDFPYLWLNLAGCVLVMFFASLFELLIKIKKK